MAGNQSILERIKDLIGDDVTDITSYKDLINSGFNYIADLIPNNSEIWRHSELNNAASISDDSSDYKIILVTRRDSSDTTNRVCVEVPLDYLRRGEDTSSIFYNAGNYKNPIFSIDENGGIIIKPTGGTPVIYYYTYITNQDITGATNFSDLDSTGALKFPEQAGYVAILKASSNLLQAQISNAVHDDEDQELLGLLNANLASIDKTMQEEMQRLNFPHQLVGDGKDEGFK
jgi:hypothetical protein